MSLGGWEPTFALNPWIGSYHPNETFAVMLIQGVLAQRTGRSF